MEAYRVQGSITSVSWIPDESVAGLLRTTMELGVSHYDRPPADRVLDVEQLRRDAAADRFRFANRLSAWMDVEDDRIVDAGYAEESGVLMGGTTLRLGRLATRVAAVALPDVRHDPVFEHDRVHVTQSAGGRAGLPTPRRVSASGVKVLAPLVWTTLRLTLHRDGTVAGDLVGASRFPRHWIFDHTGELTARTGVADFEAWYHASTVETTPWGGDDTPAVVTAVESALERDLIRRLLTGRGRLHATELPAGHVLTRQGEPGGGVALLLDGLVRVEVDGRDLGDLGPGVLFGERAALEGGTRTATLTAITPIRVAVIDADRLDHDALRELSGHHRREEQPPAD